MDAKESTAIGAQLSFRNVKVFVRNAVLCVSGQVGRARPAGISVRTVGTRGTNVRLLARDWKLVMTRRRGKGRALTRRV